MIARTMTVLRETTGHTTGAAGDSLRSGTAVREVAEELHGLLSRFRI